MPRGLIIGDSNSYGIVGGGDTTLAPDGFPRGRACKDVLRELRPGWDWQVRAVFGSAVVDWVPSGPYLPSGNVAYSKDALNSKGILLWGESGHDEVSRGKRHLWREIVIPEMPVTLAIINLGSGDAVRGWPLTAGVSTSREDYKRALHELTMALLNRGAEKVMVAVPPPIATMSAGAAWYDRLAGYREEVMSLWSVGIPDVLPGPDFFTELTTPDWRYFYIDEWGQDLLHPNELGHQRMAELYHQKISEVGY